MEKIKFEKFTWHHFEDNSYETIKSLEKDFSFHPLDIEDVSSGNQQPKTDFYKDYLFAIFHFPIYDKEQERIHVLELDVFLSQEYIITIAKTNSHKLSDIIEQIKTNKEYKEEMSSQGSAFFLYKVVDILTSTCWQVARKISNQMGDIEEEIYSEETSKSIVWRIALVRRNLIRFRRILNPQIIVVTSLVSADRVYLEKTLSLYFDDILDTLSRLQSITAGNVEVMNTLHNVNESLISQHTNEVIKLLTVISVSLLPMTLLTGIYGMNIDGLPFADDSFVVWGIFGILFLMITFLIMIFRKKDWL